MKRNQLLEIEERIINGEDSYTQFKENIFDSKKLAEELVAFSNADGGTLIIGVRDDGSVSGLSRKDIGRLNQLVSNTANDNVKPPVYPLVEVSTIYDKEVMLVHVKKGFNKPYATSSGIYITKSGADKRKVSPEELRRLFAESAALSPDEIIHTKSSIKDLDQGEFHRFFLNKKNRDFAETGLDLTTVLENMNLYADGYLTLAGIMFFAFNPQKFYPIFTLQALHSSGTDTTTSGYINKKYFSGNLRALYEQAMMFLQSSLLTRQDKETFNTPGTLEIPPPALEEAIINALIHRDYYINAPIKIMIHSDRVEIINPGKLANSLTVDKIKNGLSIARNPVFHSLAPFVLNYSGFGTGIDRIVKLCPDVDLINDTSSEEFRVIFQRYHKLKAEA
ncbi:RNA-binding domain-containing protein [Desulfamplus magnetovallimortis]|nr:RNA-binding domain-containing protein [Desulfamplus magnetovallimortis]